MASLKNKILIDGRVLKHGAITGVERYAIEITRGLKKSLKEKVDISEPSAHNSYIQHLWEHALLPKIASHYRVLFSPANICPIYKPKDTIYITTVHDLSFAYYPQSFSMSYRLYYSALTPRVLNLSDVIITVSRFERDMISLKYPLIKSKINVIYSGIDDVFFREGIAKKGDYILYVGNLSKRKNFEGLLEAFKNIYKEIDKKLVVVGMKPEIMRLSKRVEELIKTIPDEFLEFKGQINDKQKLADIYRKALAFVFPSFYESFGFPPLEAMASGTPVIVSGRAALPEICSDAAVYVDPENADSIAEAIVKVVKDKALQLYLIEKGKKRAQKFLWSNSIEKHRELLEAFL